MKRFLLIFLVIFPSILFSQTKKSDSHLGVIFPERVWNKNVRSFGNRNNLRFGVMFTSIGQSFLEGNKSSGLGYDFDLFGDVSIISKEKFKLSTFWHIEARDKFLRTNPNWLFTKEKDIFTFTTDGNFYDHKIYPVEFFATIQYGKDHTLIVGKHDIGTFFAGFKYGGSFRYFFNQSFSGSSTVSLPFGPSLGFIYIYNHKDIWNFKFELSNANSVSNKFDFKTIFNGENWYGVEMAITPKFNNNKGNYRFSYWKSDSQYDNPNYMFIPKKYGYGLSFDQELYGSKICLFGRSAYGYNTMVKYQNSLGVVFDKLLNGSFANDAFGIGFSYNISDTDIKQLNSEIFYRFQLSDKMHLALAYTNFNSFGSNDLYKDNGLLSIRFQIWY